MSRVIEATVQLSSAEATSEAVIVASPAASSWTVMSIGVTTGSMSSTTVTVTVVVAVLPAMSVTVRVTALSPRWEQSKSVWSISRPMMLKSSSDPSSKSSASMDASPFSSSVIVMPAPIAIGSVLCTMMLRKAKMLDCPQSSMCRALRPTAPSANGPVSNSAYPLSTSICVTVWVWDSAPSMYNSTMSPASADSTPDPVKTTCTVGVSSLVMLSLLLSPVSLPSVRSMAGQLGAKSSITVKVASRVVSFPQSSVAVKVTVTAPVAAQRSLNVASLWLQVTALQLSLASAPPLSASQAASWSLLPAPSHSTVRSAAARSIVGSVVSSTVINWSQLMLAGLSHWSMASAVQVRVKLY